MFISGSDMGRGHSRLSGRKIAYLRVGKDGPSNGINFYYAYVTEPAIISAAVVTIAYWINMYNTKRIIFMRFLKG